MATQHKSITLPEIPRDYECNPVDWIIGFIQEWVDVKKIDYREGDGCTYVSYEVDVIEDNSQRKKEKREISW